MRSKTTLLLATLLMAGRIEAREEKPIMAPAPAWVKPTALPPMKDATDGSEDAPVRVLLADQQSRLEHGRITSYSNLALKIQTPQGLGAGNLSFPWEPETGSLTVHKLVIHRDGELIDVLASGQTFSVLRREPNMERAMLDGVLTANIQPEGLQVGDVLEFAISVTQSDPIFKNHVEQTGGIWNGVPFERVHLSVEWPKDLKVAIRQSEGLPPVKPVTSGAHTRVEVSLDNLLPIIPPKDAPLRYAMGRIIEFSDFRSWADLGALMAPLYAEAGKVPAEGPLRAELEKIKAASTDPVKRTEAALALVQDRVRYVALLMGTGGYTPATAEETWARRFGDCKAKSALLLALLRELGIDAEPVAANIALGDGIDQRLPMVGLFNHVLVRAKIGGRDYWLDGTRSGDASLARLRTPDFGWGLPLVAKDAALVRMLPAPLDEPDYEIAMDIDARQGLTVPAPVKGLVTLRGDSATETRFSLASMAADARDAALREYWKDRLDDLDIAKVSATFDAATGEERLAMEGKVKMDWDDGQYWTSWTRVGFDADFSRTEGTNKDAPYANAYPSFSRTVQTIQLPPGFSQSNIFRPAPINETVAANEYRRTSSLTGDVFTIERTIRAVAPEFAAKDAPAAQTRLKALYALPVSIRKPSGYRMTKAEVDEELKMTPTTTIDFVRRGILLDGLDRLDESQAAFEQALKLEPDNGRARTGLAALLYRRGDTEGSRKMIEGIAIADIKDDSLASLRGTVAMEKGDFTTAIAAFTRLAELQPDRPMGLAGRANARRAAGDLDGALADSAASLKIDPRQPGINLLRANILRQRGKSDEVLAEALAAETANPDNGYAFVVAAKIYSSLDRKPQAMKALDRALAIAPEAYIYLNRAEVRPASDTAGRRADLEAALKLEPGMPEAVSGLAGLQLADGDHEGAIRTYSGAIEKNPGDPALLGARGMAYLKLGNAANADSDFAAARKAANNAGSLNNLCWTKAIAGVALEAALADCDAALAKEPNAAALIDSKGLVLLRLGRLDDAISTYSAALDKYSRLPTSLYGRSIAWSRKGDSAKAQADKEAALKIDPNVEKEFEGYGVKP